MKGPNMRHLFLLGMLLLLAVGCTTVSTSGNYTLPSGQTLPGNLVITSGNATLEAGSIVTGDVLMTSGNLFVDGEVNGDIVITSGNVSLGPEAIVHGDIRGTSGNVEQADGAQVLGQVSTSQSTFSIGFGFFGSFFLLCCLLLLIVLGGLVVLGVVLRRGRSSAPELAPTVPETPDTPKDPSARLKQLKRLFDDGLITEAEYEDKKAESLGDM